MMRSFGLAVLALALVVQGAMLIEEDLAESERQPNSPGRRAGIGRSRLLRSRRTPTSHSWTSTTPYQTSTTPYQTSLEPQPQDTRNFFDPLHDVHHVTEVNVNHHHTVYHHPHTSDTFRSSHDGLSPELHRIVHLPDWDGAVGRTEYRMGVPQRSKKDLVKEEEAETHTRHSYNVVAEPQNDVIIQEKYGPGKYHEMARSIPEELRLHENSFVEGYPNRYEADYPLYQEEYH